MRILYHFRTRGTGAEAVHISGMASAFEELGHTVQFSSPSGVDPRKKTSPFSTRDASGTMSRLSHVLPRCIFELLEMGYNALAWVRLRGLLGESRFDLIYERHAFFLFVTAFIANARRIPLVVEVNELVGDERVREQPILKGLASRCDRAVFSRAALIVVVSPHLKRRIEGMGIDGRKILVQPNAVDPADYESPADGTELRQTWSFGSDAVVIGFIGWFVGWHRLELLVETFAEVSRRHPEARLLLVGEGPLQAQLEAQIDSLGIRDRVVLAGAVPHSDIPRTIAAMDICVVPHSNEYRSPIKLFEYMGQGRPVVAPRTEPIEMVLEDGANGLLFEAGSSPALAAALDRLLPDSLLRERLGTAARDAVLLKHTWLNNARAALARVFPET